jgi:hypothetical protein
MVLLKKTFFCGVVILTGLIFFLSSFKVSVAGPLSLINPAELGVPAPEGGIMQVVFNFLLWLVTIFGIFAMIGFIVSGVQYIAASGNEKITEAAKRNITYSIIGVIVGLSGYVIILAIQAALSAATPIF